MGVQHPHGAEDLTAWFYQHIKALEGQLSASTPKRGSVVLVAGAATVALPAVTAGSQILLGMVTPGGTVGAPFVFTKTAGVGFVVHSTSGTDTSTVAYVVY
jgi:hypothetical protein